ncbi:uncharacterized protein LOC144169413 [Haemaphysalis longicornis]
MDCQLHNSEAARKALEQLAREKLELKEEIRLQAKEPTPVLGATDAEPGKRTRPEPVGAETRGCTLPRLGESSVECRQKDPRVAASGQGEVRIHRSPEGRAGQVAEVRHAVRRKGAEAGGRETRARGVSESLRPGALGKQVEESQAIAKTLREREAEVSALPDSKRALEDAVQQLFMCVEELTRELEQKQERLRCLQKEIVDSKDLVSGAGKLQDHLEEAARRCYEIKSGLEVSEDTREQLRVKCARHEVECEKIPGLESALVRQLEELLSERESDTAKLFKDLSEMEAAQKDFEGESQELRRKVDQPEVNLKASSDRFLQNVVTLKERKMAPKEKETIFERMKQELSDAAQKQRSVEEAEECIRRITEEKKAEIVALNNDISTEQETFESMAEIETRTGDHDGEVRRAQTYLIGGRMPPWSFWALQ